MSPSGSSLCARLHCCSADVLCHCIIYCRPLLAHPVLVVQVRVQLFGLTHHWEGPQTWLHISRPHMWQMQLEGNMQLPQSPLSHVARQGQFVNEAPVVSLSLDRDLQVPLSLPPSQELACGVGCPKARGRPGRGRCMARVKIQGSIIKTKPLVFDRFCYMTSFSCGPQKGYI